ncbi:hypothetical protein HYH02_011036 [Chlamydomonas schloesseri]|uniref:Mitochondrial carrier protein n=1 Tax=Chlamydomonas schloesseri TaxID=2026947 RepID=A0A835TF74_9CHLO|nr:hypothetical protein HYH02_011036 [Chlamydomonas schloesseri]|eukprot:KAG2437655.1 hypothetical protein HYH02_011036 [Chlamydomonas schloesseri]
MCAAPRELARHTAEHSKLLAQRATHTGALPSGAASESASGSGQARVAAAVLASAAAVVTAASTLSGQRNMADVVCEPSAAPSGASGTQTYDGLSFVSHMVAGSVAGTVEHTAMYPVDTIKTRMQALYHPGHSGSVVSRSSIRQMVRGVLQQDGVAGLYRGVGAVAAGAGPAHALHFAVYEAAKEALGGNREGLHPVETATAGCVATVVNDLLMTPVDSVKQRCQLEGSPYRGVLDAARSMLRTEGIGAFFRSYRTTLVMNVPFTAMHFSVYETSKKLLLGNEGGAGSGVGEDEETLQVQLVAGGLAGGCAAAVTNPLDVVKTRLQTADPTKYGSAAVIPTLRQIVREEGMQALWQGLKPRVLFHIPAAAVCWGTYETMKDLLAGSGSGQH